MPKNGDRKKAKASEVNSYVEIVSRIRIKFEDTRSITGASLEFKWGETYQMIRYQNVPDVGLEEMSLYQNIKYLGITKAAKCLELFSCTEVIVWIFPQTNPSTMIISNIEGEAFASFTPAYITLAYKLPPPQVMMSDEWVNKVDLDILECAKKMMIIGRKLRPKQTREYDSASLQPPFQDHRFDVE